ncbi:hypothetical protein DYB26_013647 [Aphanomyces astaci]|uniref:Uncharacterized protein n=1 Tax=Aphanomyces astaci TaxID=112090 RepID=A0A3R6YA40_APHAT|nr:hypothetical protein DYB26_013647 [Aphanomyces astaci]
MSANAICALEGIPRSTWQTWLKKKDDYIKTQRNKKHPTLGGQGRPVTMKFGEELLAFMKAVRKDIHFLTTAHMLKRAALEEVKLAFALSFWTKFEDQPLRDIVNVYETAVYYDMPPRRTWGEIGEDAKVCWTEKHSDRLTASSIQILLDWLSVYNGDVYINFVRWRGGTRSKDGMNKVSIASEISQILHREHSIVRNIDSIKAKIQELIDSYGRAKDFMGHTGEGLLKGEPDKFEFGSGKKKLKTESGGKRSFGVGESLMQGLKAQTQVQADLSREVLASRAAELQLRKENEDRHFMLRMRKIDLKAKELRHKQIIEEARLMSSMSFDKAVVMEYIRDELSKIQ